MEETGGGARLTHVEVESSRPGYLLQLPLRTGRSPQVVQATHHPQHRRQRRPARLPAQAGMRTQAIVKVILHRPVHPHRVGIREELGFPVGTHERREHLIPRLDRHRTATVVDRLGDGAHTVGAKGAIQADPLHGVMQELVVRVGALGLGPLVDGGEVHLALIRKVVVQELGELCGCVS